MSSQVSNDAVRSEFARDAGRSARLGKAGYVLSFVGATVFSVGNLAEGAWLAEEFGVGPFALGLTIPTVVLLGFGVGRWRRRDPVYLAFDSCVFVILSSAKRLRLPYRTLWNEKAWREIIARVIEGKGVQLDLRG